MGESEELPLLVVSLLNELKRFKEDVLPYSSFEDEDEVEDMEELDFVFEAVLPTLTAFYANHYTPESTPSRRLHSAQKHQRSRPQHRYANPSHNPSRTLTYPTRDALTHSLTHSSSLLSYLLACGRQVYTLPANRAVSSTPIITCSNSPLDTQALPNPLACQLCLTTPAPRPSRWSAHSWRLPARSRT